MERLYGVREGSLNEKGNNRIGESNKSVDQITQSDLASQLGISVDTLQNYKLLSDMIPELEELMDTGIVTKTTALAMMRNLSENEQEDLISKLDTTKKITQRKVQKYVDEIRNLKEHPVVEKFKKKIQEEAKEKYNTTVGRPSKNNRSPNGEE